MKLFFLRSVLFKGSKTNMLDALGLTLNCPDTDFSSLNISMYSINKIHELYDSNFTIFNLQY